MSDSDDGLLNTVIEVSDPFKIELSVLVAVNHQLTVEGITKLEEDEVAKTRALLEGEDPDLVASQIRWQEGFYIDMRRAANDLAVVGLVTRLQHWIERFVQLKHLPKKKNGRQVSTLSKHLEALNGSLGEGPVPVEFFEDLVTARDSVIHGDSKARWLFNGRTRTVAKRYQNGGELEVTDDQLNDAIEKAMEQVRWYDGKLAPARSSPGRSGT